MNETNHFGTWKVNFAFTLMTMINKTSDVCVRNYVCRCERIVRIRRETCFVMLTGTFDKSGTSNLFLQIYRIINQNDLNCDMKIF
jgi:hypothetical protein